MKIEELERLAVAATAAAISNMEPRKSQTLSEGVKVWRETYARVLAEFIEQETKGRSDGKSD